MKPTASQCAAIAVLSTCLCTPAADTLRQMENLGRGVIALNQGGGKVWIGWRLLGTDPENLAFNVYRSTAGLGNVRLNSKPLSGPTNFVDTEADLTRANTYALRAVLKGREQREGGSFTLAAHSPVRQYLAIPLKTPEGYSPNDPP
jgi:rhamnogalacturonan endolyase